MERVFQTRFGNEGNCVAACYATLLGINLDEVPELCVEPQLPAEEAFARSRGFGVLVVFQQRGNPLPLPGTSLTPGTPYMVSGMSPRGFGHRVIYVDDELWHDPHPEGGGVKDIACSYLLVPRGAP